ncbi:TspO/MBR family protein [Halomicrobium urmianum]|uniref:TspO/MBR family protein n=1 Tax=Halomicrobium urmianum TaxID=1586233 RepID=UPI001CDA41BB|nr:TspO/MBR family protein [Halomicrobium urmianum]
MEHAVDRGGFDGRDALWALLSVLAVNAVGAAPALLAGPDTAWFAALEKPAIYPPGWAFGVVWTLLFTLMGLALYLVARRGLSTPGVRTALALFVVQMAVNVTWTPTFFAAQDLLAGLAVIVVLDVLVAATILAFDRVDRRAALLLVPYLAWVLFATLLNYRFFALNG